MLGLAANLPSWEKLALHRGKIGEVNVSDQPGPATIPKFRASAAEFFQWVKKLISGAANGFDVNQLAMFLVCLVFLLVVLIPTILAASLMFNHSHWITVDPGLSAKILIYIIQNSGDDFPRLTAFITPFFALLAGLKSRTGGQSLFFTLFVSISLVGAVESLLVKYYMLSRDGIALFIELPNWVGTEAKKTWIDQTNAFFNTSFQTFLSFVSILLGLRAAGN